MTTNHAPPQDPTPNLTIGDLARRTGLSAATLRTWEARHGFPVPRRLSSGHRRYDEGAVALVDQVRRRRDAGVRLEVAIAEVATAPSTAAPSLFAELRRSHPHLGVDRLRKSTLLSLTRAMEDEHCARAERPLLFAAFQHERFYRRSEARWAELARTARDAVVFAEFSPGTPLEGPPRKVHLAGSAHLRREWVLVCDAPDFPACLAAWELPGQSGRPDRDRVFEALWTLDPREVREAARVCATLAAAAQPGSMGATLAELADTPLGASPDLRRATSLFQRLVAYVDRAVNR